MLTPFTPPAARRLRHLTPLTASKVAELLLLRDLCWPTIPACTEEQRRPGMMQTAANDSDSACPERQRRPGTMPIVGISSYTANFLGAK
jgi:hypothetical protein